MADFNKVLDPGDVNGGLVNTVVEIPEGSRLKVEWDRQRAAFMLEQINSSVANEGCLSSLPTTLRVGFRYCFVNKALSSAASIEVRFFILSSDQRL